MKLVDTETPNPDRFARTADGKIDFEAYVGLDAFYHVDGLAFQMRIVGSRQRFGHLDLMVTPIAGSGERWVELKNLNIPNDPAKIVAPVTTVAPAIVPEVEEVPTYVSGAELDEDSTTIAEPVTVPLAPVAPVVAYEVPEINSDGTHWTEVAPTPAVVATQEVVESPTTDMEAQVETILNEDSPVIK